MNLTKIKHRLQQHKRITLILCSYLLFCILWRQLEHRKIPLKILKAAGVSTVESKQLLFYVDTFSLRHIKHHFFDQPYRHISPNITTISINKKNLLDAKKISFTIQNKPHALAQPWHKTYAIKNLQTDAQGNIILPISGLYAGYKNNVIVSIGARTKKYLIQTPSIDKVSISAFGLHFYDSPYTKITKVKQPSKTHLPNFSYMMLKSNIDGQIILDIDGNIRWMPPTSYWGSTSFYDKQLDKIAYVLKGQLNYVGWDGKVSTYPIHSAFYKDIHWSTHDLSQGKKGYFFPIQATRVSDQQVINESVLLETNRQGQELGHWDMGKILSDFMIQRGDDPSSLIVYGKDWFHMNSFVYDKKHDEIIISSRQQFVIAIGYTDKKIKWILGDTSKYWGTFSSLRSVALDLNGSLAPIGQHAVSLNENGDLLLFNDGHNTDLHKGNKALINYKSIGKQLKASHINTYKINAKLDADGTGIGGQAQVTWDYNRHIYSTYCSSVYENVQDNKKHYLITYSMAEGLRQDGSKIVKIQGMDKNEHILFDYEIPAYKNLCGSAWNATIVNFPHTKNK